MHIFITGGTGLVGRALTHALLAAGHTVTILTQNEGRAAKRFRVNNLIPDGLDLVEGSSRKAQGRWRGHVDGVDAIINLAGEKVVGKRWSAAQKKELMQSRVLTTRALVEAIKASQNPPQILLSASAVGYYGDAGEAPCDEKSPPGQDFLAQICQAWEAEAKKAEDLGVRVVLGRIGVVLDKNDGALPMMAKPFRFFAGGSLGSGRQYLPWIHIDDIVGLFIAALQDNRYAGPLNMVAPEILTNAAFMAKIGKAMGRPSLAPAPTFVLKMALGEASIAVLGGQRVLCEKAQSLGYRYQWPEASPALAALLSA